MNSISDCDELGSGSLGNEDALATYHAYGDSDQGRVFWSRDIYALHGDIKALEAISETDQDIKTTAFVRESFAAKALDAKRKQFINRYIDAILQTDRSLKLSGFQETKAGVICYFQKINQTSDGENLSNRIGNLLPGSKLFGFPSNCQNDCSISIDFVDLDAAIFQEQIQKVLNEEIASSFVAAS